MFFISDIKVLAAKYFRYKFLDGIYQKEIKLNTLA